MDWSNHNWVKEDVDFTPKRKIENKGSEKNPHIIGTISSQKMSKEVGYQSLGECLFYYLLELDHSTIRYYVQPIEVPIKYLDDQGDVKEWLHVPDVLVFRQGSVPHLYQIKESPEQTNKKFELCNQKCQQLSKARNWKYSVIYPKKLPDNITRNLKFLTPYLKKRTTYDKWIDEIILKLSTMRNSTILDLALSFSAKTDFRYILPIIYHLIASGVIYSNIQEVLNESSVICLGNYANHLLLYLDGSDRLESL
ncbi:hypothetical protein GOP56_17140 [Brevibacillus sp. 7WMA2]|uniref:TnsA endonuclease C-terminal domain-containing protein n=1 Tax=Brevibacillus sp. 7WMA2 TaxID=2683193 RepID=UPI0013A71C54|nr:TnsA endonuclease C-terminal domain-containing protein [Brevibacillus sp. 7WMA2]QIC07169.1 hypothetical protein GOP56_17140 [Brevibacillus sp. 7WMA2]